MAIHDFFREYAEAERSADTYKGDTQTPEAVQVVEDFDAEVNRFLVVIGPVDEKSDRYVVQYTA